MGLLLAFVAGRTARAQGGGTGQEVTVTGTVRSEGGGPLPNVTVRVVGGTARTTTNTRGAYTLRNVPSNASLMFALVGRTQIITPVGGRTTIDVVMERITSLEEVVVTGYTAQRRSEITGAVSSVDTTAINRQMGASVVQRLDALSPGVTVNASGSPGSRSTVRIRGISSFQNNDPLYVVDGTPVQDSYVNWLNPEDISSIQVLKDASAASIYGSRASNGVILIETTRKAIGAPRSTLNVRYGMSTPTNGYDNFLLTNSLAYYQVVKQSYLNAGLKPPTNIFGSATNPTVPKYIWPNNCGVDSTGTPNGSTGPCSNANVSAYNYPNNLIMPGSQGTDWWKAVFHSAPVTDANLNVSGGSVDNTYGVSFNYYDQNGTARYNDYKRGTVRANTEFRRGKLSFGENLAVGVERAYGGVGDDSFGEGNILGKNILMQPVIPIRDIAGNFASGKAVGLGNSTNPLQVAYEGRNNISNNNRMFGNVFGGWNIFEPLTLRSRLGFNIGEGRYNGYSFITPQNSEPGFSNGINENQNQFMDWTWSNTGQFTKVLGNSHFDVLAGTEANAGTNRYLYGSINGLINTGIDSRYIQDALGDATTKNVNSSGGQYALLSLFGKASYNYADRYTLSYTIRRDGSSRLGPGHQWGTFPAAGLGWHITNESFLKNHWLVSDANLRYGWGVTGNQLIPTGRTLTQYGGSTGSTFYDIGGTNTILPGYRQTIIGNPNLKWEEDRSQNGGADIAFFGNAIQTTVDVYHRVTSNLLFNPGLPATAGVASAPYINVGSVQNNGVEFSVGHQGSWWNATLNGAHYKNKILKIADGTTSFQGPIGLRFGNPVINEVGQPIGAFYGYVAQGYFKDAADAAAHTPNASGKCASYCQDGAAPGRIKFADLNGDGKITSADRRVIGSPDPKFTSGLDLGARWRSFDVSATIFGSYGNKIFDAQKQFYVFRNFDMNVRNDLLQNSWRPDNQNAKYPILDKSDTYSHALSSYYVEDGSYTRLRSLQVGYRIPSTASYLRGLAGARVYLQGDNLFTITGYEGLDPSLPAQSVYNSAGADIRDQFRGVDQGTYPTSKIVSVGLTTSF